MGLGENLKSLIKTKSVSARVVARAVGISASTLSEYMSETKTPSLKALIALADYFEVTTDELIRGEPISKKNSNTLENNIQQTLISESILLKNLFEGPTTGLIPILNGTYKVTLNIEKVVEINKKGGMK